MTREQLKAYYKKRIKESKNINHRQYYKFSLKALEDAPIERNKYKVGRMVYSERLDKTFKSPYEASLYIGKSGGYLHSVLSGRINKNPYKFKYL